MQICQSFHALRRGRRPSLIFEQSANNRRLLGFFTSTLNGGLEWRSFSSLNRCSDRGHEAEDAEPGE
jgi:hypothetical protein